MRRGSIWNGPETGDCASHGATPVARTSRHSAAFGRTSKRGTVFVEARRTARLVNAITFRERSLGNIRRCMNHLTGRQHRWHREKTRLQSGNHAIRHPELPQDDPARIPCRPSETLRGHASYCLLVRPTWANPSRDGDAKPPVYGRFPVDSGVAGTSAFCACRIFRCEPRPNLPQTRLSPMLRHGHCNVSCAQCSRILRLPDTTMHSTGSSHGQVRPCVRPRVTRSPGVLCKGTLAKPERSRSEQSITGSPPRSLDTAARPTLGQVLD